MKLSRILATSTAAAAAIAASIALNPTPAQAASSVRIYKVFVNSPGSDTRTNTSLNAEYVQIKNYSSTARYITGWTVRDITGYTYKFPSTRIAAGATVVLHTGKGTNYGAHRYWQRGSYVWNNDGDKAWLKNSAGTVMHTCTWGTTSSYKMC